MNAPLTSTFRRHRTLLLVSAGIVWLLVLLALLAWWLLPRWAPNFVIRYSPMPDMVFRAAIEGKGSITGANSRLIAMGTRATPTMIAQLRHSDEQARSLALTVLGAVRDHQATDAVIAVLTDPRESLHGLAMETLGRIGDAQAIPHLLPFLSDKTMSLSTAFALQALPDTAVADALRPLMQQRLEINVLMALHDNQDPRVPAWLDAEMRSDTSSIPVRQGRLNWQEAAAEVLGNIPQTAGSDLLVKAMADVSPVVRKRSVQGLTFATHRPLSEAERTAILHLLGDADTGVIEAAVLACNSHGLEAAIPILLQLLDSPDPAIRKAATYGFGVRLFDEQATAKLITLSTDPSEQIRGGAVNAIGRIAGNPTGGDVSLVQPLIQALSDVSPRVRKAAVYGLTRIKHPQATSGLLRALEDPDSDVREVALGLLSHNSRPMTDEQQARWEMLRAKIQWAKP